MCPKNAKNPHTAVVQFLQFSIGCQRGIFLFCYRSFCAECQLESHLSRAPHTFDSSSSSESGTIMRRRGGAPRTRDCCEVEVINTQHILF